jgi:CRISPR-associated protein Csd2
MPDNNIITNRYDFVYLFEVRDGNPNGDPDAGNQPRIDPETGHGLVTDVCLKRKIRNFVSIAMRGTNSEPQAGYDIYVKERGILANEQRRAYQAHNGEFKAGESPNDKARAWMCQTFYDIRAFGAVMTTGKIEGEDKKKYKDIIEGKAKKPQWNCGQVRGPVQLTFARSITPILSLEHAITRCALTNASDTGRESTGEDEKAATLQMGRKMTVPYALYRAHGFVSANLAEDTRFSEADLALLWRALCQMYEHDRSATRGQMAARGLYVFKHSSKLGNAPAHVLQARVSVKLKDGVIVARSFDDFLVTVDRAGLPSTVELLEYDCSQFADVPLLVSAGATE